MKVCGKSYLFFESLLIENNYKKQNHEGAGNSWNYITQILNKLLMSFGIALRAEPNKY